MAAQLDAVTEKKTIITTCGFCGVGCNLEVTVDDNKIVSVKGYDQASVNHGETCVKGSQGWEYVHSGKRLTKPLIRKNGELVPTTWNEALDVIADKFTAIKNDYGSEAFGCFTSSRQTNELLYLSQKFTRTVLGTNSVDNCART